MGHHIETPVVILYKPYIVLALKFNSLKYISKNMQIIKIWLLNPHGQPLQSPPFNIRIFWHAHPIKLIWSQAGFYNDVHFVRPETAVSKSRTKFKLGNYIHRISLYPPQKNGLDRLNISHSSLLKILSLRFKTLQISTLSRIPKTIFYTSDAGISISIAKVETKGFREL